MKKKQVVKRPRKKEVVKRKKGKNAMTHVNKAVHHGMKTFKNVKKIVGDVSHILKSLKV